jgi:hypothetical protein
MVANAAGDARQAKNATVAAIIRKMEGKEVAEG